MGAVNNGLAVAACIATGCNGASSPTQVDAPTLIDSPVFDAPVDVPSSGTGVVIADRVLDAPGGGDPSKAIDGVRGAGTDSGSADVYSLGYAANNSITLAWSGGMLANGAGADFAVFENPFAVSGGGVFMDLIVVQVSRDGTTWHDMPHHYASATPTMYSTDPALWIGFAGKTPVLYNVDTNPVDPFGGDAGGDTFDLDDVANNGEHDADADAIRTTGICCVKLVTAPSLVNPDTGAKYVKDPVANGADIDGVFGRYVGI